MTILHFSAFPLSLRASVVQSARQGVLVLDESNVRFGYVGCGFVAQRIHIPNFSSLPECEFLALAEVREDLGRRIAARYGIPRVYRSHEDLAQDSDIEA